MDENDFVGDLASLNNTTIERVQELIKTNESFAEIFEEHQEATAASLYWKQLKGEQSTNALQYIEIVNERQQELGEILRKTKYFKPAN
jgi:hypothetical protein